MLILVTGANGQLGYAVRQAAREQGHNVLALSRAELDITDRRAVATVLKKNPGLVINCAAFNNVESAETEPGPAFAVNRDGPGWLAESARLVHVSTDYVFDGESRVPYKETDAPNPVNVYGESKRAGEEAVLQAGRHFVVRTSWVFGPHGGQHNFVRLVLKLAAAHEELRMVSDQTTCPTFAPHLAEVALALGLGTAPPGIYHYADSPAVTRYDYCRAILAALGLERRVVPVLASEFPSVARRPACSALDCEHTMQVLGRERGLWEPALRAFA